MSQEERRENLWRELLKTAETIACNREKTRELIITINKALVLRDEVLHGSRPCKPGMDSLQ